MHARYEMVSDDPGKPLVIRDVGPWDKHRTVTNDADHVVRELFDSGRLRDGRRLFYYDTNEPPRCDELVYDHGTGEFRHFAPVDPQDIPANGGPQ